MNDAFHEQLVQKKSRPTDGLIRILVLIIIVLLIMATPFVGMISTMLGIVLGAVAYYFIFPRLQIEYEYSLLNTDLDIDIIYNKAKRKRLMSLDLKNAEVIAPRTSHRLDSYRSTKTLDYSAGDTAKTPYCIMISIDQAMTAVLIQPDSTIISRLESFLPRTFFKD